MLQNHSAAEVRRFIEEGFDPGATLHSTDDPEKTLVLIDELSEELTGEATSLTFVDVREYLASLAEQGR